MAAATAAASGPAPHVRHLVVPGQVIAVSGGEGDDPDGGGFLRGHGTYVETFGGGGGGGADGSDDEGAGEINEETEGSQQQQRQRLVASVLGTVERVNKLISVIPASSGRYSGQVGDLVIGRISAVGATRWRVNLTPSPRSSAGGGSSQTVRDAHLPLSGVDLPGGVQRIRTAEDARSMRSLYREGESLSAEVQGVQQNDGSLMLHTRSLKYGKLENGCMVCVPPGLVRRMKQHMCTLAEPINVDLWIGCNGGIWIQRSIPKSWDGAESASATADGGGGGGEVGGGAQKRAAEEDAAAPQADTLRRLRARHASTPVLPDERENIARVRNSVECLRWVHRMVTPENVRKVYESSEKAGMTVADMLRPENVVRATECTRI